MKKQEAVRQEFRRGAEVVRNLPVWMQELEQHQTKAVKEKSTSVVAEKTTSQRPLQKRAKAE